MPTRWEGSPQYFITAAALSVKPRKELRRIRRALEEAGAVEPLDGIAAALAVVIAAEEIRRK